MPRQQLCPCGTGRAYVQCCQPFHDGAQHAPTAEALMRSRYTAFALGKADYLVRSWHPSTRPGTVQTGGVTWVRLEVLSASGGLFETEGVVEFRAHHEAGVMAERSRFVREDGRWYYLDGVAAD